MKKFALLAIFAGLLMASCSSSDEPSIPSAERLEKNAHVDLTYSRSLSDGFASATYKRSEYYMFDKSILTNGKWEYFDWTEYLGASSIAPATIAIQDGKAYTSYSMFSSSTGPTLIGRVWNALAYANKEKKTLCIARKFEVLDDNDGYSVIIGNHTFALQGLTKDSFQLAFVSNYLGGASKQGGQHKEISIYKAVTHEGISSDVIAYESEEDLVRDIVEKARAQFGDILDLNEIYKGKVEFDDPERHKFVLDDILRFYGVE